jgi:hypothetical protein
VLCGEVSSPQLELMQPIFSAPLGVRILAVQIGKFHNDIIQFDTFEIQEFDAQRCSSSIGVAVFSFPQFISWFYPTFLPGKIQNFHLIHEFHAAVNGRNLDSSRKGKPHSDQYGGCKQ